MMFSLQLHRLNVARDAIEAAIDNPNSTQHWGAAVNALDRAGIGLVLHSRNRSVSLMQDIRVKLDESIHAEENRLMEAYNNMAEQGLVA